MLHKSASASARWPVTPFKIGHSSRYWYFAEFTSSSDRGKRSKSRHFKVSSSMLQILIIIGWLFSFACMLYLAIEMLKDRLYARRQKRLTARELKKRRQRDLTRNQFVLNSDRAVPSATITNGAVAVHPHGLRIFGWLMLFLWEGYWFVEIADYYSKSSRPSQLPYFFLFIVLVVIPYAAYLLFRRMRQGASHS